MKSGLSSFPSAWAAVGLVVGALVGCSPAPSSAPSTSSAAPEASIPPAASTAPAPSEPSSEPFYAASAWIGHWAGPEGTSLVVDGGDEAHYSLIITNLDGPRTFEAVVEDRGLVFTRDGVKEHLRASDGDGTGMKWLAGKRDCLVVKPGEGYCRD